MRTSFVLFHFAVCERGNGDINTSNRNFRFNPLVAFYFAFRSQDCLHRIKNTRLGTGRLIKWDIKMASVAINFLNGDRAELFGDKVTLAAVKVAAANKLGK